ncbi:MAG: hypothetical protein WD690_00860 [Vicinamibacterales bacterium]
MKQFSGLRVALVVLVLGTASSTATVRDQSSVQGSGDLKILATRRAEVLKTPFGTYTSNSADDVMLLVQVRGLAPEEFEKIAKDRRFVLAGERQCELLYTLHWETGEREMAFAVPRAQLKLELVLGERKPTPLQPSVNILKELVSPLK